jgi:hypothetical protein
MWALAVSGTLSCVTSHPLAGHASDQRASDIVAANAATLARRRAHDEIATLHSINFVGARERRGLNA